MADATKFVAVTVLDGSRSRRRPTVPRAPPPAPPELALAPAPALPPKSSLRLQPQKGNRSQSKSNASLPSATQKRARRFEVSNDDAAESTLQTPPTRRRSKSIAASSVGTQAQAQNAAKQQWRLAARHEEAAGTSPTGTPKSALKPSSRHLNQSLPATPPSRPPKAIPFEEPSGNKENSFPAAFDDSAEAARLANEVARLEAETDRILAEQKKRDLARLQARLAPIPTPPHKPKTKHLILDKLPFLLPKNSRSNGTSQPTTPQSAPAKTLAFVWSPTVLAFGRTTSPRSMSSIEPGGGGIVPQTDAPTSAINGGERRVTVRCLTSTINLPVNKDTTPIEIAYSTANFVTHKITPANCVIIEYYEVLGIERRLRQYERIRDVMNSWDRDQQNTLLVTSYDTPRHDADLELDTVPRTDDPPTGFTFQLYHSARPGRWNKRWVTLMDSGQIYASKRPDSKPTDKDSAALCHMSDFDIYTPRETQMKRHLKAPKKFCYAIKSQQKTHLFPNGENFVHFFSVEDEQLAHRFYELVHGWRNWYLVNKKIDFESKEQSSPSLNRTGTTRTKSHSVSKQGPPQMSAMGGQTSYVIGEFQPLLDMSEFDKPLEEFGKPKPKETPQVPTMQSVTTKPMNKGRSQIPSTTVPSAAQPESEFLSGGLLGDSYEKRKASETVVTAAKQAEGPFIQGTLLNRPSTSPTTPVERLDQGSWFPSAQEHSARNLPSPQQRPSIRRPRTAGANQPRREDAPPPLPGFHRIPNLPERGPSQRRDVGRGVKPPIGSPLIDFATGGVAKGQAMPARSASSGAPPSGDGPATNRPRSRSTATSRSEGTRHAPSNYPPVPPLPPHPAKRYDDRKPAGSSASSYRSRYTRHDEPLINRVK